MYPRLWTFPHLVSAVILGGAGIGSAIGLIAHHARTVTGDPAPTVPVPETPPLASH